MDNFKVIGKMTEADWDEFLKEGGEVDQAIAELEAERRKTKEEEDAFWDDCEVCARYAEMGYDVEW